MVIKGIEEVRGHFELSGLGDVEALSNAHVPVVNARLAQPVAGRVAKHAEGGLTKAAKIDTLKLLVKVLVNIATR